MWTMFIFQGEIEMQKKTDYPETVLQRVATLCTILCSQNHVGGILQQLAAAWLIMMWWWRRWWRWFMIYGDEYWFVKINVVWFSFPSFAELTPKPSHILQKHSMSMWFLLAGCAFRQIAKGIGCLGTSKREKPGKIHHTVPGQQAWLVLLDFLPVTRGMVGMVFKSCGKVKCQQT